jgi:hypothetical protein
MLDWTTSFLSDALIIKPEIAICQTLSWAIQHMAEANGLDYNWWKRQYGMREGGSTIATDVERRAVAA